MDGPANLDEWASDAERLYELARELLPQTPRVELTVSRKLADQAVDAWHRDDDPVAPVQETDAHRTIRH